MRHLFKYEPLIASMLSALVLFVTLLLVDVIGAKVITETGQIFDRGFSASTKSTGIGVGITRDGAVPVVTSSGHPDEWNVIVKTSTEYIKVDCSITDYYANKVGDEVTVARSIGILSGINYSNKLK